MTSSCIIVIAVAISKLEEEKTNISSCFPLLFILNTFFPDLLLKSLEVADVEKGSAINNCNKVSLDIYLPQEKLISQTIFTFALKTWSVFVGTVSVLTKM